MRTLIDSTGVQWTVFEVKRAAGAKDRMTYLPEQFGDGWLCFESSFGKRRLTPVPPHWRDFGEAELERSLVKASPVHRPKENTDRPAGSTGEESRA